jgi:CheY-like chemotaxis protein
MGINSEFLPHVFELFRQADSKTTRTYGGLGLGLAIVRNLVESHGGTVRAESGGEGQGSTFTIFLPQRSGAVEVSDEAETTTIVSADSDEQEAPEIAPSLEGLRVLIVEDDGDSRQMLSAALAVYGGEVRACSSSATALEMLSHWLPDVIVSDIGMPREDGYDLIKHVRELAPEHGGTIPALALTGYASEGDKKRALAAGYQMHISKPVELTKLATAVVSLAERSLETKPARNQKNQRP